MTDRHSPLSPVPRRPRTWIRDGIDVTVFVEEVVPGLVFRGEEARTNCPLPGHEHDVSKDFAINRHGLWKCHKCGLTGNVLTLARALGLSDEAIHDRLKRHGLLADTNEKRPHKDSRKATSSARNRDSARSSSHPAKAASQVDPLPAEEKIERASARLLSKQDCFEEVVEILKRRGITETTIRERRLGILGSLYRVAIPVYDAECRLVNVKQHLICPRNGEPKALCLRGHGVALYGVERLTGLPEGSQVLLAEGELDSILACQEGFHAVSGTGGATTWVADWGRHFFGYHVAILYDIDEPGREGADLVVNHLRDDVRSGVIKSVRNVLLQFPKGALGANGKPAKDLSDFFAVGHTAADLRRLIDATPVIDLSGLPRICLSDGLTIPELVERAWAALLLANESKPELFRFAGGLHRVERNEQGTLTTPVLNFDRLMWHLTRAAEFFERTKDSERIVSPPGRIVKELLATPEPPLRTLRRITLSPSVTRDGRLVATRGYDPLAEIFYDGAIEIRDLSEAPTPEEVATAKAYILNELLVDFPFVDDADRAHAVALLLGPFVREMIDGPTPLHMIEKPTPGTGASLLVEAIARGATGTGATTITEGRDEDEWRKRITATLFGSPTIVSIDNLRHMLDSAALASVLTSTMWTDRVLGLSENRTVPNVCVWVATGNNPDLSTEMTRRTISIRLDAKRDHPEDRKGFRHENLLAWVQEHREKLVRAVLVLIRAWIAAGRPIDGVPTIGMFESWAKTVGGILKTAGIPGFLGNLKRFRARADGEGTTWRQFVAAWWERHRDRVTPLADLAKIASELDLGFGGKNEKAERQLFGMALKRKQDCLFGDVKIEKMPDGNQGSQYRLVRVCEGGDSGKCGNSGNPPPRAKEEQERNDDKENIGIHTGGGNLPLLPHLPLSDAKPGQETAPDAAEAPIAPSMPPLDAPREEIFAWAASLSPREKKLWDACFRRVLADPETGDGMAAHVALAAYLRTTGGR